MRLAAEGLADCRGCKRRFALRQVLTTWFGGGLAFAICWECLAAGRQVIVRRVETGIEVVFTDGDRPLIVTPGASEPDAPPANVGPTRTQESVDERDSHSEGHPIR